MIIRNSTKFKYDKQPMIKGHTKIELTDIKTKFRKVVESENTFQASIIAEKMRGGAFRYGEYDDVPFANGKQYFYTSYTLADIARAQYRNTVGGILLFDDVIPVGSKYMPAGVKMTANGAWDVVNTGTPQELGSYNAAESTNHLDDAFNQHAFQFVYDWGTSQGNGDIASVCLTSKYGGAIGMGNPSGEIASTRYNPCAYQTKASRLSAENCIVSGDYTYFFGDTNTPSLNMTTKTLTVRKYTFNGISKASVFDGRYRELTFDFSAAQNVYSNATVPAVVTDGKGIILIFLPYASDYGTRLPVGAVAPYIELDTSTDTFTLKSFTNNTGTTLYSGYQYKTCMAYDSDNDYLMCVERAESNQYDFRLLLVDLTTGNIVKVLSGDQSNSIYKTGFKFADGLWYCGKLNDAVYVYDEVNDTLYPTNGACDSGSTSFFYTSNSHQHYVDDASGLILSRSSAQNYCFYNPCFLSTINNLENPVTKNVSQTMKVTYTLTEV